MLWTIASLRYAVLLLCRAAPLCLPLPLSVPSPVGGPGCGGRLLLLLLWVYHRTP